MTSPGTSRDVAQLVLTGSGVAGGVVIVIGTFLPWLGSGAAERNSYAAGGAVRRLLTLPRPLHDLLGAWPLLGFLAALALAAVLLGHPRVGLTLATVLAVVAGGCAIAVLPVHSSRYARVLTAGPATTLVGAMLVALTALAAVGLLLARRAR